MSRARRLIVTAFAVTGTTTWGARRLGTRYFLPDALVYRFARLAGVEPAEMNQLMTKADSFEDEAWVNYWVAAAEDQQVRDPRAAAAYRLLASWPGGTPARRSAYRDAHKLLDSRVRALAETNSLHMGFFDVATGSEPVRVRTLFPADDRSYPAVLVVGGLDGTAHELLLSLAERPAMGVGFAVIEMPGSGYSRTEPLAPDPSSTYTAILECLRQHPQVERDRVGMLGLSFGAHGVARVAAANARLLCAVVSGIPAHHSFGPASAVGVPSVMLETMRAALGASGIRETGQRLRQLSIRHLYRDITLPLLVVNGDSDTIACTQDSRDLAEAAPLGELLLYPGDDHCAVHHFDQWLDHAIAWMSRHLR